MLGASAPCLVNRCRLADAALPTNGGSVTVDHRVSDFDGVYVVHCHILHHEDRGMMINVMTAPSQEQDPGGLFPGLDGDKRTHQRGNQHRGQPTDCLAGLARLDPSVRR